MEENPLKTNGKAARFLPGASDEWGKIMLLCLQLMSFWCLSRHATAISMWRCPERTWSGCSSRKVSQTPLPISWPDVMYSRVCSSNFLCFTCRVSAGPGQHTRLASFMGRREARWRPDLQQKPWTPQVCPSVSLGPPFRARPRHPDLLWGRAHTAQHCPPCPPSADTALLCLHQMWQGVLGRLSLRPRPLHVSGGFTCNGRKRGIACGAQHRFV